MLVYGFMAVSQATSPMECNLMLAATPGLPQGSALNSPVVVAANSGSSNGSNVYGSLWPTGSAMRVKDTMNSFQEEPFLCPPSSLSQ